MDKSNRKNFTTRLDPYLLQKLKMQAIKENCTVSDIINELVRQYLRSKGVNV
jgi:hypothetical protein